MPCEADGDDVAWRLIRPRAVPRLRYPDSSRSLMRSALARLALVVVASTVVGGCRPGTALHRRYDNFRAYYNTYYNATRSLEEGELALERSAVTLDRSRLVPIFPETATAGGTTGPFQDTIDKSAELLRNRPSSKWADDALLLIGKAYFYQRNLAGAEQKFRETMAAAALTEDRRLGDEARFWLGRTYAASDRFDEGVGVLEEGLADEGGDRRWTARMRLALGELYARAGRWDEAAETLRAGAPAESEADVAARAYVLLGQVEEHAERWDRAAEAYQHALERQPAYELAFAARVGRALVLGVDAGQTDDALAIVRQMRGDDKNYARRGELALVEARLRSAAGETRTALGLFRDVLYEPELEAAPAVKGQTHYRLAEFYRDALNDYVRASAHFDSAATLLRAPATDLRASRGAISDVADEARTYAVVATAARRIAEVDSLMGLGALDETAFQARIGEIEAQRREVYLDEQRRLESLRTAERFRGGSGLVADGGTRPPPGVSSDVAAAASGGFLSHRDPASVQAGRIAFAQRWGNRPLVPNWRRRSAVQSSNLASTQSVVSQQVQGGLGLQGGPPPLDLSAVPRTPAKRAELATELAGLRYQLANAFFLSLGRADTAAVLYRTILTETPDLDVATRARYALAEIERAAGRDDVARPLYQAVAASDTTALARSSRLRLGVETESREAGPVETSGAYDRARIRWRQGDPLGGMQDLLAVGDRAPSDGLAPRSYLAAAAAYLDWAAADSVSLTRPLPDSLVSSVLFAVARGDVAPDVSTPSPEAAEQADDRIVVQDRDEVLPRPALQGRQPADREEVLADGPSPELRALREQTLARRSAPSGAPDVGPLARPDSATFTLRHHLTALATRYPGTPYAERALALATALPLPDPTEPVAPDSLASEPEPEPDASDVPLADGERPDAPAAAADPASAAGLRGDTPLDPSDGGFTWRVQRVTLADEAASMVTVLRGAGYRVATLRDEAGVVVVLGQFGTQEAAEAARSGLPAWAQIRGEVIPMEGLRPIAARPSLAPDL